MKKLIQRQWKNALITGGIFLLATLLCSLLRSVFDGTANAQVLFILAVLIISRFTQGYFWGVFSALISVPLVNIMFTYPYYTFNLTLTGYLLTFITMLMVSIIVSVLTTRLKQQEHIRAEAEKEKLRANLLRAVSHDLRTPLTSIIGSTGAILDNDLPPEKQRELIADVHTDAQWLLRMIENLLAITRVSGGNVPLHTKIEVLEEVLAEAVIKFQKHFAGIEVNMRLCDEIVLADMDAVLIEQVVLNLLENAVYHGKHTTSILITTKRSDGFVSVAVTDNGAGIDRERCSRLFTEPLKGGASADAQKHMGMGLYVCMSIIHAHGGDMSASSTHSGASFTFTLPEARDHA